MVDSWGSYQPSGTEYVQLDLFAPFSHPSVLGKDNILSKQKIQFLSPEEKVSASVVCDRRKGATLRASVVKIPLQGYMWSPGHSDASYIRSLDLAVLQRNDSLAVKQLVLFCWTAWYPGHGLLTDFFLEAYLLCQGQLAGTVFNSARSLRKTHQRENASSEVCQLSSDGRHCFRLIPSLSCAGSAAEDARGLAHWILIKINVYWPADLAVWLCKADLQSLLCFSCQMTSDKAVNANWGGRGPRIASAAAVVPSAAVTKHHLEGAQMCSFLLAWGKMEQ